MNDEDQCQYSTTKPKAAFNQSARGGSIRYQRCKNKAKHTIEYEHVSLAHTSTRTIRCCGLHKRLYEERGWLP